jgi:hypothetical protein
MRNSYYTKKTAVCKNPVTRAEPSRIVIHYLVSCVRGALALAREVWSGCKFLQDPFFSG